MPPVEIISSPSVFPLPVVPSLIFNLAPFVAVLWTLKFVP